MTTVVVQSHPVASSYNAALLDRVQTGLKTAKEPHTVFRLGRGEVAGNADLAGIDRLVLVYPTWWGGQPAELLAWLQEVLASGDAVQSVEEVVAVTTLGSSRLVNWLQGEWGRANLAERVLGACAPDASFEWTALYDIDRQPSVKLARFLDTVELRFAEG